MDSHDIFKQLTTGARFLGKRKHYNKSVSKKSNEEQFDLKVKEEQFDENDIDIKTEDEDDSEYWNSMNYDTQKHKTLYQADLNDSFEIKEEIKSEDETSNAANEMQLLNSFGRKVIKKKKAKILDGDKTKKLNDEQASAY